MAESLKLGVASRASKSMVEGLFSLATVHACQRYAKPLRDMVCIQCVRVCVWDVKNNCEHSR